jgi:hypothetical protein
MTPRHPRDVKELYPSLAAEPLGTRLALGLHVTVGFSDLVECCCSSDGCSVRARRPRSDLCAAYLFVVEVLCALFKIDVVLPSVQPTVRPMTAGYKIEVRRADAARGTLGPLATPRPVGCGEITSQRNGVESK